MALAGQCATITSDGMQAKTASTMRQRVVMNDHAGARWELAPRTCGRTFSFV